MLFQYLLYYRYTCSLHSKCFYRRKKLNIVWVNMVWNCKTHLCTCYNNFFQLSGTLTLPPGQLVPLCDTPWVCRWPQCHPGEIQSDLSGDLTQRWEGEWWGTPQNPPAPPPPWGEPSGRWEWGREREMRGRKKLISCEDTVSCTVLASAPLIFLLYINVLVL